MIPPPVPTISASPAPSASPRELKTIITVISSPYCNSLADHFNSALVPMLGNDRTLQQTGASLDTVNTLWDEPNYEQLYLGARDAIGKQIEVIGNSLDEIQRQIDALRAGDKLSSDPNAAAQIRAAAAQLQLAFDKQRQMEIDLTNLHRAMIDYHIERANPAMGGFSEPEMSQPPEMRDIKSYLRFDGRRDAIADAEGKAVDIAYAAAQTYCTTPAH
ncbi:MAG TPA: hypothetical protein VMF61_04890 [Candidatus Acidoferrales bacterium]|nr:hypothetical protein [Candidatus Acidoferrales bacterium]